MKKKSLIVLMTVTLVIAAFGLVGPSSAKQPNDVRAVFEADIIPVASQSLVKGEAWIRESGNYKVEIEGAEVKTTYDVYLLFGVPGSPTEIDLGELKTDEEGEDKLIGNVPCYNAGVYAGPWIEIRCEGEVHFVSGFALETCIPVQGPAVQGPDWN